MQECQPDSSSMTAYLKENIKDESCSSESGSGSDDVDSSPASIHHADASGKHQSSKANETRQIEDMARGETINLRAWRLIVLIAILTIGALVTTGTFFYLRNQKRADVEANVSSDMHAFMSHARLYVDGFISQTLFFLQTISMPSLLEQ